MSVEDKRKYYREQYAKRSSRNKQFVILDNDSSNLNNTSTTICKSMQRYNKPIEIRAVGKVTENETKNFDSMKAKRAAQKRDQRKKNDC